MITPDMLAMLDIMGSDMLREYRDAILKVLAKRNQTVAPDNVVRDNVLIEVHIDDDVIPGWGFRVCQEFVLHPGEMAVAAPSIPNVAPSVYISARWL